MKLGGPKAINMSTSFQMTSKFLSFCSNQVIRKHERAHNMKGQNNKNEWVQKK